jgi:hypothetical protein
MMLIFFKFIYFNLINLPNSAGNDVNLLSINNNVFKLIKLLISAGNDVNLLLCNFIYFNLINFQFQLVMMLIYYFLNIILLN